MEKRGEFNSSKNILIRLILKMTAETDDGPYKRQSTLAISWVVQPNLVFQQDQLLYTGSFKLFVNFYVCKSKNSAARLDGLEILKIVSPLILRI